MFTLDSETNNQKYLVDQAKILLPLAHRHKFPLSLIRIEIDNFTKIIDTYGQKSWDIIIQCMGILIKSTSRQEDIMVRYNDEGFAILLSYCDLENAIVKAERLKEATLKLNPDNIAITASIGVAATNGKGEWNHLLEAAFKGLHKAKQLGGNQIQAISLQQ